MEAQASTSPNGSTSNKRRRVRKACLPCRQRKRKCDAEEPCGMCSQYGYDCIYPEDTSPLAQFVARRVKSPHQTHSSVSDGADSTPTSAPTQHQSTENLTDASLLEPSKTRYVHADSAYAFPRALGFDFQSRDPPPLHSFAYTFGIRPEEKAETHSDLRSIITEHEVTQYSGYFFSLIAPIFDILEAQEFYERCRKYYLNPGSDFGFGAIIAQVAALGSFLAVEKCHSRELDLVQYCKRILEDPQFTRRPAVDHVVAWECRTLYLRATTRPNNAWLASCQTVHVCESIGLHDEACVKRLAFEHGSNAIDRYNLDQLRRIFWGAIDNNTIISCEYGRACVVLPHVTTEDMKPRPGSYMHLQHRLAKACPSTISSRASSVNPEDQKASLFIAISSLVATPSDHPFIAMTKADLCFCFYRRLRQQRIQIPASYVQKIIDIGEGCLESAVQFAKERRPYWPVLGSVFQFSCVLLAMDTQTSLARAARAFRALEEVVTNINTHMSREALATARLLLRDAVGKKKRELALLEAADGRDIPQDPNAVRIPPLGGMGSQQELNIDWDIIFDESYNSFFGSPQFDEQGGWTGPVGLSMGSGIGAATAAGTGAGAQGFDMR